MSPAIPVVLSCALAALLLSWLYARRYTMKRAPLGVLNLADVLHMMAAITLIPLLYLLLPRWAVAGLLAVETVGLVYLVWEPVLEQRGLVWLLALALVGADLAASILAGSSSRAFFAANDLLLVVVALGVANIQAQSGLRARDATVLGAFLIGYDFIATTRLPLMNDLFQHLAGLPFSPIFAWPLDNASGWAGNAGDWAGLGMGDVVLGTLFPLVLRKAYGRTAGLVALAISFATYVAVFVLPLPNISPVMVFLGPLMIGQYLYWRLRQGTERTMRQYLQAEPI